MTMDLTAGTATRHVPPGGSHKALVSWPFNSDCPVSLLLLSQERPWHQQQSSSSSKDEWKQPFQNNELGKAILPYSTARAACTSPL